MYEQSMHTCHNYKCKRSRWQYIIITQQYVAIGNQLRKLEKQQQT